MKKKCFQFLLTVTTTILLAFNGIAQIGYETAYPNLPGIVDMVELVYANDGTARWFVVDRSGYIKVFDDNPNVNTVNTFLDLSQSDSLWFSGATGNENGNDERGLLGFALHPNFDTNKKFYIYYTRKIGTNNPQLVLREYIASSTNENQSTNTYREIFAFTKVLTSSENGTNHNGGKILFGPDNNLYISIGDGGDGGDPSNNAQNLNNPFGAILRIDVNGNNSSNGQYGIPSDNPRVGLSGIDELYAWGFRNTWRMSFDSSGILWGGDVGQDQYDEINKIEKGGNYGWRRFEGPLEYTSREPLVTVPHKTAELALKGPGFFPNDESRSITGGHVYEGAALANSSSNIYGKYIWADFRTGKFSKLENGSQEFLFDTPFFIPTISEDPLGELYFTDYSGGKIYKIIDDSSPPQTEEPIIGIGFWCNVTDGLQGSVKEILPISDTELYAVGSFGLAHFDTFQGWNIIATVDSGAVTSEINSIVKTSSGEIFVAGNFTTINGVAVNNIARFDTLDFFPLNGGGTNGKVWQLSTFGNKVYVAGSFNQVNGNSNINKIGYYDGSWHDMGSGANNEVRALDVDANDNVYIGGNFTAVNGVNASFIAKYSNNTWSALGSGCDNFVLSIAVNNNAVYAGGAFSQAGAISSANRIAKYDMGTQSWSSLGTGLDEDVVALTTNGNELYVGGSFGVFNNSPLNKIVNNIAKWTGTEWKALGPGFNVGTNGSVATLEFFNNKLFVGGGFSVSGNTPTNNLSIWSETQIACPDISGGTCPSNLLNEDTSVTLSGGLLLAGLDEAIGTATNTNGSPCALQLSNTDTGQLFTRFKISIDLETNNLTQGDQLFISLDGNSTANGNARVEVNQDNLPNTALLSHNFGNSWSTKSGTITIPSGIETIDLWLFPKYNNPNIGSALFDNLIVQKVSGGTCPSNLLNEDTSVTLSGGLLLAGLDEAIGTATNTNGSPCALQLSNTDTGQLFTRFKISIDLETNNLTQGDQLFISLDGNSTANGNARVEVNQDNLPNTALLSHNFGNSWSTKSGTITIPSGIETIDLWLFPKYNNPNIGSALFDNLIVQKVSGGTCPSNLLNEDTSVTLSGGLLLAGLDEAIGTATNTNGSPCALQLSNTDTGQLFTRFKISIDLETNNLTQGDQLFISLDGNSTANGNARVEVNQDNLPNTALLSHNFGNSWSTKSGTITIPSGIETIDLWLFPKYNNPNIGSALFDNLIVQKVSGGTCPSNLLNEDTSVTLSGGLLLAGLDEAIGTATNTNGSPCALQLSNTDTGQLFTRFKISIDLETNNLTQGDQLFISLDGNSTANGNARVEVNQDNLPNTALLSHNFGNSWSTKSGTITIPSGIETIDLWLFPKYNNPNIGSALFDNLIVQKVSGGTALRASLNIANLTNDTQITTARIFPNPSTNETQVNLSKESDYNSYRLFSLNGALVKKGIVEQGQRILSIPIYDIENGMYLLNLSNNKGESIFMKLIKE